MHFMHFIEKHAIGTIFCKLHAIACKSVIWPFCDFLLKRLGTPDSWCWKYSLSSHLDLRAQRAEACILRKIAILALFS